MSRYYGAAGVLVSKLVMVNLLFLEDGKKYTSYFKVIM
jgi:hypothetical protein